MIKVLPNGCLRNNLLKYKTSKEAIAVPLIITTITDTNKLLTRLYSIPIILVERL
jgi:hypothetical protein